MPDREKVVEGLERCMNTDDDTTCIDCPYNNPTMFEYGENFCLREKLMPDAVKLLKEQEPVEPIPPTDESDLWRCGNCNHQLFRCTHQRYCEMCGWAVKWE